MYTYHQYSRILILLLLIAGVYLLYRLSRRADERRAREREAAEAEEDKAARED
jgi:cbb3-type cytochrome oxidase subunit 3